MDRIHGGCGFLITADLHVLLGTDCTARHPPTWCQSIPIWGCLEGSVVQNQQADADYTFSRYNGADLHVSLSFLFSFSYPAAWNESRDTWVFCYLQSKDNRTAVWEVSHRSVVFAKVFCRMQKLTDFWKLWLFSHFHLLSEVSAVSTKFFPFMKENITFKSVYFGFFCLHLVWLEFVYHKAKYWRVRNRSLYRFISFSEVPFLAEDLMVDLNSSETLIHFLMECAWKYDALALDAQLKSPCLMKCCACMSCSSLKCQTHCCGGECLSLCWPQQMWVLVGAVSNVLNVPFASLANIQRCALWKLSEFWSCPWTMVI